MAQGSKTAVGFEQEPSLWGCLWRSDMTFDGLYFAGAFAWFGPEYGGVEQRIPMPKLEHGTFSDVIDAMDILDKSLAEPENETP